MDEMLGVFGDTLLRLDGEVIEVFKRIVAGSQRTPLIWAGADLKPQKGDQIQVTVGSSRSGEFYTSDVTSNGAFTFRIPVTDEPRLRSLLDEAARRASNRRPST